mmetsp:Transcript_13636/g.37885  ORF Transcript_13636/g.37885 Transcript_13636/m.37885 type:complete len:272 (-) Transcript_13636:7-822(-)
MGRAATWTGSRPASADKYLPRRCARILSADSTLSARKICNHSPPVSRMAHRKSSSSAGKANAGLDCSCECRPVSRGSKLCVVVQRCTTSPHHEYNIHPATAPRGMLPVARNKTHANPGPSRTCADSHGCWACSIRFHRALTMGTRNSSTDRTALHRCLAAGKGTCPSALELASGQPDSRMPNATRSAHFRNRSTACQCRIGHRGTAHASWQGMRSLDNGLSYPSRSHEWALTGLCALPIRGEAQTWTSSVGPSCTVDEGGFQGCATCRCRA